MSKPHMTPDQAAQEFKRLKAAQEEIAPKLAEARRVLVEHFEATSTTVLEGVGLAVDTRSQLDTTRVRAFLGDRVNEFTKSVTSRTVYVLEGA